MSEYIEVKCPCGRRYLTRDGSAMADSCDHVPADLERLGLVRVPPDAADTIRAIVDRLSEQFGYLPAAERERLTAEIARLRVGLRAEELREFTRATIDEARVREELADAKKEIAALRELCETDERVVAPADYYGAPAARRQPRYDVLFRSDVFGVHVPDGTPFVHPMDADTVRANAKALRSLETAALLEEAARAAHPYREAYPTSKADGLVAAPKYETPALQELRLTPTEFALVREAIAGIKPEMNPDTRRRDVTRYDTLIEGIGREVRGCWASYSPNVRTTLFGNTNVGQYDLTNMNCSGMLCSDNVADFIGLHLVVRFEDKALETRVRDSLRWRFSIGECTQREGWASAIKEPTAIVPIHLLARQNFDVDLEFRDARICDEILAAPGRKLIRFDLHMIEHRSVL